MNYQNVKSFVFRKSKVRNPILGGFLTVLVWFVAAVSVVLSEKNIAVLVIMGIISALALINGVFAIIRRKKPEHLSFIMVFCLCWLHWLPLFLGISSLHMRSFDGGFPFCHSAI